MPSNAVGGGNDEKVSTTTNDDEGEDEDEGEDAANYINNSGLYLDEETYLQAEDRLLRPDGSLDLDNGDGGGGRSPPPARGGEFGQQQQQQRQQQSRGWTTTDESSAYYYPPVSRIKNKTYRAAAEGLFSPAPSYSYMNPDDDDDDDDDDMMSESRRQLSDEEMLILAVNDIENRKSGGADGSSVIDPETLHRQVFAEEQTYLLQSEGFRKALSTMMLPDGGDVESPMAKDRRESIERYNDKVLSDLMREMDEMEEMAISREEAMGLVVVDDTKEAAAAAVDRNNTSRNNERGGRVGDEVLCYKCGLRVTPDMIQRAEVIEIISNRDGGTASGGGIGGGGGGALLRRKYGDDAIRSSGMLCSACYGQRFRAANEATLRTAVWAGSGGPSSFGGGKGGYSSSSPRMFDNKKSNNSHQWSKGDGGGYDGGRREWNNKGVSAGDRKSGSSSGGRSVQGISTSSLFDMPETGGGYNTDNKGRSSPSKVLIDAAPPNTPGNTDGKISARIKISPSDDYDLRRRPPPRRASSILGGGKELARRMQRDTESGDKDDSVDQRTQTGWTLKVRRMEKRNTSKIQGEEGGNSPREAIEGVESKGNNMEVSEAILDTSIHSTNGGESIILTASIDDDKDEQHVNTSKNNDRSWVKIEDPASKQILYWNTETGEMKKTM